MSGKLTHILPHQNCKATEEPPMELPPEAGNFPLLTPFHSH